MAKVFPNLHKKCVLGMSWLEYENSIIDWTQRRVIIQPPSYILILLVMHKRQIKPSIETVNLGNAKQVALWFCWRKLNEANLVLIRPVKDKEQKIMPIVLE